jgi:DNA-binding response OmpR family regulator
MSKEENNRLIACITALMAMLCRKLLRAQALSSRTEELLDDVTRSLNDLQVMVSRCLVLPPNPDQTPFPLGTPRRFRRLARVSAHGVVSVNLVPRHDGSAVAQIDGVDIPLPQNVAALLDVLMADRGVASDRLVGWKTVADIQAALKESTKQPHSKAAVKELVYRLRGLLERHGESRLLVQNNRRLGYRFTVRRGRGAMTEGDNQ